MAGDNTEDQEKTEPASPRRLEKAREEGQIARSRELNTFLLLICGIATLWSMGGVLYGQLGLVMEQSFMFERNQVFDNAVMLSSIWELGRRTLLTLLPLFLLLAVVALFAPMALGGWMISVKALAPQISRLNPMKGLKRIFSSQALAELGKVIAKALLVGSVLASYLWSRTDELLSLMQQSIHQALVHALTLAAEACALMASTLIVVAALDVPYQLWTHAKKLRMSKEEVKREHKESEGDPQIKGRLRAQRQAMARQRMMTKVPEADVIVTNPTHYAVALQYVENRMGAPRVVAKGADAVAEAIRRLGRENGVPLLEAPPLARALYGHVDLEEEIPASLYTAVAEVLAWAFRLKRARASGEDAPRRPVDLPVPDEMANRRRRRRRRS